MLQLHIQVIFYIGFTLKLNFEIAVDLKGLSSFEDPGPSGSIKLGQNMGIKIYHAEINRNHDIYSLLLATVLFSSFIKVY